MHAIAIRSVETFFSNRIDLSFNGDPVVFYVRPGALCPNKMAG